MTRSKPVLNVAASVKDRLLRLARERDEPFNFLLQRYVMERFLHRLSLSPDGGAFVLKGATLFTVWSGHPHRATKDIDLLGAGAPTLERLADVFREVCRIAGADDGFAFDPSSVRASRIKEDATYEGVRVALRGTMGSALLDLQVDVGFGDVVTPAPVEVDFPTLLGAPAPRLRTYPRETVVAEKLEAMVQLGLTNSRMKDFFDLRFLAREFAFDGGLLTEAIAATFARRGTALPVGEPVAFTPAFYDDPSKRAQWAGFLRRASVVEPQGTLAEAVADVRAFLAEPLAALGRSEGFARRWAPRAWQ